MFSINTSFANIIEVGKFTSSPINDFATDISATSGQPENQSRAQQSTNEGNLRHLTLKASPTGDIQSIICKLFLTLSTKVLYTVSVSPVRFNFFSLYSLLSLIKLDFSSGCQRLGTSPELRMLFMSSKNPST